MSTVSLPSGGSAPTPPNPQAVAPPIPKFDAAQASRFFRAVVADDGGPHEIRLFHARYSYGVVSPNDISHSSTFGGWYDKESDYLIDLQRIDGVSAYVTVNPAKADLLARCNNRLKLIRSGQGTKDEDILAYKRILLDIDPKRDSGISATDDELAKAIVVRDKILADHPEIAAASIWGKSGNGAWILVRMPDTTWTKGKKLAETFISRISLLYSIPREVEVDPATINASRVMCVPGTVKCKGSHMPNRPHRMVTLDSEDGREIVPLDIHEWLKQNHYEEAEQGSARESGENVAMHASEGDGHATPGGGDRSSRRNESKIADRVRAYLRTIEPAIAGEKGSNQAFHVACTLVKGFNLTPNEAFLFWQEWNRTCQPPWSNTESWHKLNDADKKIDDKPRGYLLNEPMANLPGANLPARAATQGGAGGNPGRNNEVLIVPEEMEVNNQVCELLTDFHGLYQRNYSLVEIIRESIDVNKKRIGQVPEGTPMITTIPNPRLREIISSVVRFRKLAEGRQIPAHPPDWCVSAIQQRRTWDGLPNLQSLVEHPALRADGSVIDQPGFDERSGVFWLDNCSYLPVPEQPSQGDARAAAGRLLELVDEFPFQDECHRGALLACLLTILSRHLINDAVPLFLFEASASGSGKTLLCDIISIIATGRVMVRSSYYHDSVEMDKQIVSIALGGIRTTMLDNIEGKFGNSALDNALTGRYYRGRVLGKSEMTSPLLLDTVFVATGNNIEFCGDVFRRIVPCRLASPFERPDKERTEYRIKDIKNFTLGKRAEIIRDALTMMKAYMHAGAPEMFPVNVYADWTRLVRASIKWAIGIDCLEGQEEVVMSDQERMAKAAIVDGIYEFMEYFQKTEVTASEILDCLKKEQYHNQFHTLREGFSMAWKRTDLPTLGSLSKKLSSLRKTVFGNLRVIVAEQRKHTYVWTIERQNGETRRWERPSWRQADAPPF